MASEWWISGDGTNRLKGVEVYLYDQNGQLLVDLMTGEYIPDPENPNPPRLSRSEILLFLCEQKLARESFDRIIKGMLPEEQERLLPIRSHARPIMNDTEFSDHLTSRSARAGVGYALNKRIR